MDPAGLLNGMRRVPSRLIAAFAPFLRTCSLETVRRVVLEIVEHFGAHARPVRDMVQDYRGLARFFLAAGAESTVKIAQWAWEQGDPHMYVAFLAACNTASAAFEEAALLQEDDGAADRPDPAGRPPPPQPHPGAGGFSPGAGAAAGGGFAAGAGGFSPPPPQGDQQADERLDAMQRTLADLVAAMRNGAPGGASVQVGAFDTGSWSKPDVWQTSWAAANSAELLRETERAHDALPVPETHRLAGRVILDCLRSNIALARDHQDKAIAFDRLVRPVVSNLLAYVKTLQHYFLRRETLEETFLVDCYGELRAGDLSRNEVDRVLKARSKAHTRTRGGGRGRTSGRDFRPRDRAPSSRRTSRSRSTSAAPTRRGSASRSPSTKRRGPQQTAG
jgi:hypothetical protein